MRNANPAVVVVSYNRPECLARLLSSLDRADYSGFSDVPLVISLDKSDETATWDTARSFMWPHGSKRVIERETALGWFEHAMVCADLTTEYETIILLEDDLYVAPGFYAFASQALDFYAADPVVAGISLYSIQLNEYTAVYLPFQPLQDQGSVFFLQKGIPWGWAVSASQWQRFRKWFADVPRLVSVHEDLPARVISWPASSFSKYLIKYLVACKRYIVYPRKSLTANFGPIGVHRSSPSTVFQVPLDMSVGPQRLTPFDDSLAVYDAYYELLPSRLDRACGLFSRHRYAVDLYGTKDLGKLDVDYVLTARRSASCLHSFARQLMPMELNVIEGLRGAQIRFCSISSVLETGPDSQNLTRELASYYYANLSLDESSATEIISLHKACLDKELVILGLKEELDSRLLKYGSTPRPY